MEYTVRPYKKGEEQYVAEAHRRIYREEYNWGPAFSEYAAAIALDFAKKEHGPGEELWVAEDTAAGRLLGCIMLCDAGTAQASCGCSWWSLTAAASALAPR